MNTRQMLVKRAFIALVLALCAHGALAATARVDLRNDTTMTHGFLFADNPVNLQFLDLEFFNAMRPDWTLDVAAPAVFVFSGPLVQPTRGRLRLSFDHQVPQVSFQWAEVLFDGVDYAIQSSGTVLYDAAARGNNRWNASSAFSAANGSYIDTYFGGPAAGAVPLPNSVVLLLSAIAFMGYSRRGSLATTAAAAQG